MLEYTELGKEEGARLLCGGQRLEEDEYAKGYFHMPTVLDQVTQQMRIAKEEIFGPVIVLIPAASMSEALQLANDSQYGLSASLYTSNISDALTFAQEMDAGMLRVNAETAGIELQAPFGGMKQSSSYSREQGSQAIEFFASIKTVSIKTASVTLPHSQNEK